MKIQFDLCRNKIKRKSIFISSRLAGCLRNSLFLFNHFVFVQKTLPKKQTQIYDIKEGRNSVFWKSHHKTYSVCDIVYLSLLFYCMKLYFLALMLNLPKRHGVTYFTALGFRSAAAKFALIFHCFTLMMTQIIAPFLLVVYRHRKSAFHFSKQFQSLMHQENIMMTSYNVIFRIHLTTLKHIKFIENDRTKIDKAKNIEQRNKFDNSNDFHSIWTRKKYILDKMLTALEILWCQNRQKIVSLSNAEQLFMYSVLFFFLLFVLRSVCNCVWVRRTVCVNWKLAKRDEM